MLRLLCSLLLGLLPGVMVAAPILDVPFWQDVAARINTQPFILDHGDDVTDFPGDEFLLGYWLGRYVRAIRAP